MIADRILQTRRDSWQESEGEGAGRRTLKRAMGDFAEIEAAAFWKDGPRSRAGELRTEEIPTEIFLLPAAGHAEKDGTFTNTQRLLQWHHKAVEPPGDARSRPLVRATTSGALDGSGQQTRRPA